MSVKEEKGFALVLTLVVTALMVAVAAEMIHQVYVDTSLSRGFRDGQQASLLAESGVTGGTKLLQFSMSLQDYTALSDKWATPLKLDDETGTIVITATEESGKINLNALVRSDGTLDDFFLNALKLLGRRLQVPDDCWYALADWLDSNDETRSGGAETPYYKGMKPPYNARNDKLATLAELTLVKGFTPDIVAKLRPFVTVHAVKTGDILNINTAPKEVIAALDNRIDDRMADRIMDERRIKPFKKGEISSRISGFDTIAMGLVGRVDVKGSIFKVTSVARVKDTARTVEAVVRPGDSPPGILSWQEY